MVAHLKIPTGNRPAGDLSEKLTSSSHKLVRTGSKEPRPRESPKHALFFLKTPALYALKISSGWEPCSFWIGAVSTSACESSWSCPFISPAHFWNICKIHSHTIYVKSGILKSHLWIVACIGVRGRDHHINNGNIYRLSTVLTIFLHLASLDIFHCPFLDTSSCGYWLAF